MTEYWIVGLLIVCSALFSGTETAYTAANKVKLRREAAKDWKARGVLSILEKPDRFLAVVLIGNNIANIFAASLLTAVVVDNYGEEAAWPSSLLLTLVILLFAEITPKTAATLRANAVAKFMVPFVKLLEIVLAPAVWITTALARGIFWLLRIPRVQTVWAPTAADLRSIFDHSEAQGQIREDIGSMLDGVLDLSKVTAEEVMVPRGQVVSVGLDDDMDVIREVFLRHRFSRLAVYKHNPDNVIGYLASRDLFRNELLLGHTISRWQSLVRPLAFHLDITTLREVLKTMRANDASMAGVVDEYGGFEGLLTLEDILQEIVYSAEASAKTPVVRRLDGSMEISGTVPVRDVLRMIDEAQVETEAETLGGWALHLGGRSPGDILHIADTTWHLEVLAGDAAGIALVRMFQVASLDDTQLDNQ